MLEIWCLNLTGTLAGTRVVNVPDGIEKTYIVADRYYN
jgi:hypothetical protein